MLDAAYKAYILEALARLDKEGQLKALEYIKGLSSGRDVPGASLLRFAGSIPLDDLERMEQAIEEGCETIDTDGW